MSDGPVTRSHQQNMSKQTEILTISTHIGWSDYDGQSAIYTGNFKPRCEASEAEVLAYLGTLKAEIVKRWPAANLDSKSLSWEGSNGRWYQGRDALAAVEGEISRLTGATARHAKVISDGGTEDDAHDAAYNP